LCGPLIPLFSIGGWRATQIVIQAFDQARKVLVMVRLKKISSALLLSLLSITSLFLLWPKYSFEGGRNRNSESRGVSDRNYRETGDLGRIRANDVSKTNEFYVPPKQLNPIVNYGSGWYYFPYEGKELKEALRWFVSATGLEYDVDWKVMMATQTRDEANSLPVDPGRYKGHFIRFRTRVLSKP
jgi:hypothetical protein